MNNLMEDRIQKFDLSRKEVVSLLKKSGIYPTKQRVGICVFLLKKPQHLTAEQIYKNINSEIHWVSQATIYNTLKILVDSGIINELIINSGKVYYDSNIKEHFHFVDLENDEIIDLDKNEFSFKLPNNLSENIGSIRLIAFKGKKS